MLEKTSRFNCFKKIWLSNKETCRDQNKRSDNQNLKLNYTDV